MVVSKKLILGLYLGGPLLGGALLIVALLMSGIGAAAADAARDSEAGGGFMAAAGGFMLLAILALVAGTLVAIAARLFLYYKGWSLIQDGQARTTPAAAIGFLFIPFFNIYWVFQCVWGFSVDYNKYIVRHGANTSKLPEGLFLTACILPFAIVIPILGWFFVPPVLFVIEAILISKMCDGINTIAATPNAMAATAR